MPRITRKRVGVAASVGVGGLALQWLVGLSLLDWVLGGLVAMLATWIFFGVRRARKRAPGETGPVADGGSFNVYRGR